MLDEELYFSKVNTEVSKDKKNQSCIEFKATYESGWNQIRFHVFCAVQIGIKKKKKADLSPKLMNQITFAV